MSMSDSDDDSSGIDLEEILGLPTGFQMGSDASETSEEEENSEDGPMVRIAEPLYLVSEMEFLVMEGDVKALETMMDAAMRKVQADEDLKGNPVVELQLEVLQMAIFVAQGEFIKVIKSPCVQGLVEPERNADYGVSRVKTRMGKYIHTQLVQHIESGIGACVGDPKFRDPSMASPDNHVNQKVLRSLSCMYLAAACFGLFVQVNYTGPALNDDVLNTVYPLPFAAAAFRETNDEQEPQHGKYVQNSLESISADARALSASTGKNTSVEDLDRFPELTAQSALLLAANGETIYGDAKLLHFLHFSRVVFRSLRNVTALPGTVDPVDMLEEARREALGEDDKPTNLNEIQPKEKVTPSVRGAIAKLKSSGWWSLRSAGIHQESLEDITVAAPSLQYEAERGLKHAFKFVEGHRARTARLWLEGALMRHKFKDVDNAKIAFQNAREAAGLDVKLTGALGKRTKYQESKAQLLLLAGSSTTQPRDSSSIPKPESLGIETVSLEYLDADTPLHENIQYDPSNTDELLRTGKLSLLDQGIVLGLCVDVKNSYAMEGLTAEEMLAYVGRITQAADNWMIYSTALLLKSQLEFERIKTKERAVLQMQVLVDQQSDRLTPLQSRQREIDDAAPVYDRFLWLYGLAWPALWELKRGLANRYLDLGVAGSALKIFEEVKMWEQAADCLVLMDKRHRAEQLVRERMAVKPTPNLMCVLGNLLQDASWFEKAWKASGMKYSRAKRLWAIDAFGKGHFHECITHLQDALKINPLYPGSWFRLGSAAMRVSDWKLARTAFARVTAQNPEDGDGWANLATVLSNLNEKESALQAVTEAVKFSSNNWKIWENYIFLSLQASQWGLVMNGISNMIDLRRGTGAENQVDVHALLLVVDHIITIKPANEPTLGSTSTHLLTSLRSQLENLFSKIKSSVPSNANVWKVLSMYYDHFGMHELYRDCLMKRMRAVLGQNEAWMRDSEVAEKVLKVVTDLYKRYSRDVNEDPALGDDGQSQLRKEAVQMMETVIAQYRTGTLSSERIVELEQLLSEHR